MLWRTASGDPPQECRVISPTETESLLGFPRGYTELAEDAWRELDMEKGSFPAKMKRSLLRPATAQELKNTMGAPTVSSSRCLAAGSHLSQAKPPGASSSAGMDRASVALVAGPGRPSMVVLTPLVACLGQ